MPIHRSRTLVAATAVALLATIGASPAMAAASAPGGPTPDTDRAARPAPVLDTTAVTATAGAFTVVRAQAERAGTVRVIVGLRLRFDAAPAVRAAMRGSIATARSTVEAALRGTPHTVTRRYASLPYLAVDASPAALDALRASGTVASVHADRRLAPQLDQSTAIVHAQEATAHGFDGTNQVIAVLDTGVDRTHPFLAGRIAEEACFSDGSNCPNGATTQVGVGAAAPCPYSPTQCAHGTHVAGIAAGRHAGTVTFDGVAPQARLLPVQVFSRKTGTDCLPGVPVCAGSSAADLMAALEHVDDRIAAGVNVAAVNVSVGTVDTFDAPCDTEPMKAAIDALRARGVPTVIASGNSFSNSGVSFPACITTAVVVGNTTDADAVNTSSNSSPQVDLLAPGTNITSSMPGGGMDSKTGTSMAAPHVAGAWAVYRERYIGSSVDTVLAAFRTSGPPVTDPDNGVTVPRLNLSAAMAGWGFVWANEPTNTDPYTPSLSYQANSTGAAIENTITREATGRYLVRFTNLGGYEQAVWLAGGANAQVTAYGGGSHHCKIDNYGVGGSEAHVHVLCLTAAGVPVDARFTVLYQANETVRAHDAGYALVWADGSAPIRMQANSSAPDAVNTVLHTAGSGLYTVQLPGLTDGNGVAQVTAYGDDAKYCKPRSTRATTVDTQIVVGCHNTAGLLTDSAFMVSYTAAEVPSGRKGAYGVAFDATATAWYPLNPAYNPGPHAVSARRKPDSFTPGAFLVGTYQVRLSAMPNSNDTNVIVMAQGSGGTRCGVEGWNALPSPGDTDVTVVCRTSAGALTNHPFTLLYTTNLP